MSEGTKHWRSCVKFILGDGLNQLEANINDFCKGKFVVGIQYPEFIKYDGFFAVVSFKVLDE